MHLYFRHPISHRWFVVSPRARVCPLRHRAGVISARLMLWLLVLAVLVAVLAGLIAAPLENQSLLEWLTEPFQTPQGWA